MAKILLNLGAAFLTIWGASAGAYTLGEVSCGTNGCLYSGWTVRDFQSGQTVFVDCIDGDCNLHGWNESSSGGRTQMNNEVVCENDNCFGSGWTTYDRVTHQIMGRTRCLQARSPEPSCFNGGWIAQAYFGASVTAYCVDYDCARNGWFVYLPNGGYQRSYCKAGGCFEQGWTVEQ